MTISQLIRQANAKRDSKRAFNKLQSALDLIGTSVDLLKGTPLNVELNEQARALIKTMVKLKPLTR